MARERYLIGAEEDTLHTNVITADTPKEKWDNWWYYNRRPLVLCLIAAAIVGSLIYSIVAKAKPDYTVALMTSYTMPENGMRELERCLTEYADDRNGDGKVEVAVVNYVFSSFSPQNPEQYERQQISLAKLVGDITTNDSMIYLHDEGSFASFTEDFNGFFLYNSGEPMPSGATDFENAMRPWAEMKAFDAFQPVTGENEAFTAENLSVLYGDLRISFRSKKGTSIENRKKDELYWEKSLEYFKRLEAGVQKEQE